MRFANNLDNDCIHNIRTEQKRGTALSGKLQVNVMMDAKHDVFYKRTKCRQSKWILVKSRPLLQSRGEMK